MRMSFPGFLDLNEQSSTSFLNLHHMKSVIIIKRIVRINKQLIRVFYSIRKLLWHSTEIFVTFRDSSITTVYTRFTARS